MGAVSLRNKYRNSLLELIQAASLDPRKFTPEEESVIVGYAGYVGYCLRLEDSTVVFKIATSFSNESRTFNYCGWECEIAADGPRGKDAAWSEWTSNFKEVEEAFKKWLNSAARKYFAYREEEEDEITTPDLWEELKVSSETSENFRLLKNTRFSVAEQSRIADELTQSEKEIQRRQLLSPDELRELHEQVNLLIGASKRLGRKDWVLAATGALFSFTLQAGLNGATASQVLQLATSGLQWIVVHLPLLPP